MPHCPNLLAENDLVPQLSPLSLNNSILLAENEFFTIFTPLPIFKFSGAIAKNTATWATSSLFLKHQGMTIFPYFTSEAEFPITVHEFPNVHVSKILFSN